MTAQALEIAQHLEPGPTQTAGLDGRNRSVPTVGMANQIARSQHDLGTQVFMRLSCG